MKNSLIKYGGVLLAVAVIVAGGLMMFRGLPNYKDLILWDEAFYMLRGLTFFSDFPKEWGPLYCFWYLLLYLIPQDTVQLYYLNFKILAIAGPVLLYLFLRKRNIHPIAAILLAIFFLFSDINISSWPYVSHFCVVVLLLGMWLAAGIKNERIQWMFICGLAFVLSLARPEFYLAFLMLTAILSVHLILKRTNLLRLEKFSALAFLLFIFAGHLIVGATMFHQGSGFGAGQYSRQVFAFGNHYAINVGQWRGIEHAWLIWESLFAEQFEISDSFFATIASNWPEFFRHIWQNIVHYLEYLLHYWSDLIIPGHFVSRNILGDLLCLLLPVMALAMFGNGRKMLQNYYDRAFSDKLFIALLILAVPVEISCVIIYPRDHYLLLQMPFFIYAVALIFQTQDVSWRSTAFSIVIGGILLVLAPKPAELSHFSHWNQRAEPHNLMAVKALQKLEIDEDCILLEEEGGLSLFVQNRAITSVFPVNLKLETSIVDYIQNNDVKIIFMSYMLDTDPNLSNDTLWHDLKTDPESYSFKRQDIPGSETYLLIHESI